MRFFFSYLIGFLISANAIAQNSIIFFSESPQGDTYYDASWGSYVPPSYLELAHNNDKFPVDARHHFQGNHSLRLRWNSQEGGDWGIAVASINWMEHDVSQYDSINYWINSPKPIAQSELPEMAIEDIYNQKSTRIWLGDYFQGVDWDTTTWQKVSLPLDAFQPGPQNCNFTRIKTIFHYQKDTDGVDHIVWLDEIRIIRAGPAPAIPFKPGNFMATAHDSRIDLTWKMNSETDLFGYFIYRSPNQNGPYTRLNNLVYDLTVYCDFIGLNDQIYYYYITATNSDYEESVPSDTVSARTFMMTDDELLTSVQEATFRFFYEHGHPVSGLARELSTSGDVCATGGSGFGLMTLVVGSERGFVPRDTVAVRVLKILRFLQDQCTRYHGAWSHWIDGETGQTIPFSDNDDGADLVETAYLIQGMLTVRQYFDRNNAAENEIRQRATQLWEGVEWDWYRRTVNGPVLYWHWSPTYQWRMNLPIAGFNECMIVYLLAIASPTHPVPASLYDTGWASNPNYANGRSFYGYKQWVGTSYGGPLFFTHYSFMGFDPRDKRDRFCNYFENNRNIALIHRAYAIKNPLHHAGYDSLNWGLTACFNPWGYGAHEPMYNDNGTIAPTAAISSMPYAPEEAMAALKNFYFNHGPQLWGEFGFRDAFNLGQNWYAPFYVAIDQGPIVPMIENYRTGLCWKLFMSNPEITPMLKKIGWTITSVDESETPVSDSYELAQNYPNPFNSGTIIRFSIDRTAPVSLEIYNLLGQRVHIIYQDQIMSAGRHQIRFDAGQLPSGIYLYQLKSGHRLEKKKMVLMR